MSNRFTRWLGVGVGAVVLVGGTIALSVKVLAQGAAPERRISQRGGGQPGQPGQFGEGGGFGGGQPGFPGGGGFGGGGYNGPGFQPMGPMMGGGALTATDSTVYVLRGNTLYAFDAKSLKLTAKAELPQPAGRPGGIPPGGGGGFGGDGGGGGGFGGGR